MVDPGPAGPRGASRVDGPEHRMPTHWLHDLCSSMDGGPCHVRAQSRANVRHIRRQLQSTRKEDLTAAAYMHKMKALADAMAAAIPLGTMNSSITSSPGSGLLTTLLQRPSPSATSQFHILISTCTSSPSSPFRHIRLRWRSGHLRSMLSSR